MDSPEVIRLSSTSPEETVGIGEGIGRRLPRGSVVLLTGPLGSGKTTLAKGIARGLGITEEIISPTYTIVSEYPGERHLYHVDLYRIEGRDQTESLALDDFLWSDGISVIEWGEKLDIEFPRPPVRVTIGIGAPELRTIAVEGLAP